MHITEDVPPDITGKRVKLADGALAQVLFLLTDNVIWVKLSSGRQHSVKRDTVTVI